MLVVAFSMSRPAETQAKFVALISMQQAEQDRDLPLLLYQPWGLYMLLMLA